MEKKTSRYEFETEEEEKQSIKANLPVSRQRAAQNISRYEGDFQGPKRGGRGNPSGWR